MFPYFHKLNKRIISDELSQKLIEYVHDNENDFTSLPDGNWYLLRQEVKEFKEISELIKSCNSTCSGIVLIKQLPNTKVRRHVDRLPFRRTVLTTPLLPYTNYSSTNFYENTYDDEVDYLIINDDVMPVASIDFSDRNSVLFNTSKWHDLTVNDLTRVNFQILFSDPFEDVYKLALEDKLFN